MRVLCIFCMCVLCVLCDSLCVQSRREDFRDATIAYLQAKIEFQEKVCVGGWVGVYVRLGGWGCSFSLEGVFCVKALKRRLWLCV